MQLPLLPEQVPKKPTQLCDMFQRAKLQNIAKSKSGNDNVSEQGRSADHEMLIFSTHHARLIGSLYTRSHCRLQVVRNGLLPECPQVIRCGCAESFVERCKVILPLTRHPWRPRRPEGLSQTQSQACGELRNHSVLNAQSFQLFRLLIEPDESPCWLLVTQRPCTQAHCAQRKVAASGCGDCFLAGNLLHKSF